MAIVVIDAGHGGAVTIPRDSTWNNAVGPNGTLEKNLTLDIALRVISELKALGHTVAATRTTDVNRRFRDRAVVAKKLRADAFVSIHFNGSTKHNAQGTETLVELNHTVQSARLSLSVQDALLPVTGLKDRNKSYNPATRIKPQSLGVLRLSFHHPDTAACLTEVSFLDRADEELRLADQTYRAAIAKAIAKGVDTYIKALPAAAEMAALPFGDAIEAAAAGTGNLHVQSFLRLDTSSTRKARRGEATEKPGKLPHPFSIAFLNGSGAAMAIAPEAAGWDKLDAFITFIGKLKLKHFNADEFLELGGKNGSGKCKGLNTFPPEELWPNIANTALMLDQIRTEMGAAIRILSCYRSPAYNTCIDGEPGSLHMRFNAIDFTCQAGTPETWRRIAARLRFEDPRFVGGIGVYPARNFVHIDTRGKVANW